jgi:type IV secretory pathway VirB3-like protein
MVGLTVNMSVGAGIFGLPSKVYGLTGVWSLVAYLICAALVTLVIICSSSHLYSCLSQPEFFSSILNLSPRLSRRATSIFRGQCCSWSLLT